ncbi:MAG: hypothetical protein IKU57_04470 [Oscillospiraceae bacterium]|nr:hypothetical protein [Oscillospiraceae bacterium]
MQQMHKKNLLAFSLLWIGVYVVGFSLSVVAGPQSKVLQFVTAAVLTVVSLLYGVWIIKHTPPANESLT